MIEVYGDLWKYPADARVITTNGFVKVNGEAVMGRGCALEAKEMWPFLPSLIGQHIKYSGNTVGYWKIGEVKLFTFPVKHNWWEVAQIDLIEKSCIELVELIEIIDDFEDNVIVMPRPGCGNGKMNYWVVKPILEKYLDNRFHVITNE
jgi:hypothetical protein